MQIAKPQLSLVVLAGLTSAAAAQPAFVDVTSDYMSSGFFGADAADFLRGEEAGSGRAANRVTSPNIFGVTGETTYFEFDFDWTSISGPVQQAVLRVENVSAGFFPDVDASNPAEISVHSLSADPLAAVDQTLESGAGSWLDFRDSEITTSSIVATTTIDSFGVSGWDVTSLVNEWIANGNANFAYTVGTSALLDPEGGAAVAFVNSSFSGLTGAEFTARIEIIPTPATVSVLGLSGLVAMRRRR